MSLQLFTRSRIAKSRNWKIDSKQLNNRLFEIKKVNIVECGGRERGPECVINRNVKIISSNNTSTLIDCVDDANWKLFVYSPSCVLGFNSDTLLSSGKKFFFCAHAHRSESLLKALNLFLNKQRRRKIESARADADDAVKGSCLLAVQHISLLLDNEGRYPTFWIAN